MSAQLLIQPHSDVQHGFSQVDVQYRPAQHAIWYAMAPFPKPCFNPVLLRELHVLRNLIRTATEPGAAPSYWKGARYVVGASAYPDVFSLGGDLALFRQAVMEKDVEALRRYATLCIELLHSNSVDLDRNLTTITLVRGKAAGGGMEMALSATVVIAERSSEFGLPETLFGLFPGMGAYQLIARRAGINKAEEMIRSGRVYKAQEMLELGLIDVLAEDGEGEMAVDEYIQRQDSAYRSFRAIHQMRRMQSPVRREDLLAVIDLWVEAAMELTDRQLKLMHRLAKSQERLLGDQRNVGRDRPEPIACAGMEGVPAA